MVKIIHQSSWCTCSVRKGDLKIESGKCKSASGNFAPQPINEKGECSKTLLSDSLLVMSWTCVIIFFPKFMNNLAVFVIMSLKLLLWAKHIACFCAVVLIRR